MSIKPLGSEKLQGDDKIKRILEIASFGQKPQSNLSENKNYEYKLTLADGNEYQIIKEKVGYIIKKTISESENDYIEPMKNRKYYPSYSQALKRLNLMAKEMNTLFENEEGTSLFSEQKKFVLKTPGAEKKNPEPSADVENVPPPAPEPAAETPQPPTPPSGGETMPEPPMDEMGTEEPPMDEMGTEEPPSGEMEDKEEGDVSFKVIQKLTGKLGQKLRALSSKEEEMSSKDIKYVVNSILSALDLNKLEDEDKEEILTKFEDVEAEEDMGTEDSGEEPPMDEMGGEEPSMAEMGSESTEEMPEGEMVETDSPWTTFGKTLAVNRMADALTPGMFKGEEMTEEDDDTKHIKKIANEMFVESKVENILTKYFSITEDEKKFNKELTEHRKTIVEEKTKEIIKSIHRLSESKEQENKALSFYQKNRNLTFVGRTNKKNLVFEINNKQFKITPQGRII